MAVLKGKDRFDLQLVLKTISAMNAGIEIKEYKDKTVFSKKRKPRKRKPTRLQKPRQLRMADAVLFARRIIADPIQKASWKKLAKDFTSVYQAAISWYMKNGDDPSLMPSNVAKIRKRRLSELGFKANSAGMGPWK